ncbi:ABC transporter permease [Chelativorans xinjiangense]|uniref:ABC transporter permease n=1 Tax=Chelativorans xinjiangense TaxID=2681485 RepID=UPI00135CBDF4|nr:ABC transporter permease [Chelativorans xinjiangense]
MLNFTIRRLLGAVPVLGFIALFVFALLHLAPGDPAGIIAGEEASPEDIARIYEALNLDRPLPEQFGLWLWGLVNGDFGVSIYTSLPVLELVRQRLEPTISLAITTIIFSVVVAIPLGAYAAWRAGSLGDRAVMIFSVLGFSVPTFVLGYLLIYFFAGRGTPFPVQGFVSIREGLAPFLRHIALPTFMLGTSYMVLIMRITRASVLEILNEDYIRTARAKGVPERKILTRHALRNAAVPIVTVVSLGFAFLVSGVVITESVFNIPGLGRLTVEAISKRDYPVIQGLILLVSATYVLINTATDITYAFFDPRIRY